MLLQLHIAQWIHEVKSKESAMQLDDAQWSNAMQSNAMGGESSIGLWLVALSCVTDESGHNIWDDENGQM